MRALALILALAPFSPAAAEVLVAARMIPARTVLTAADLAVKPGENPAAMTDPAQAIGLETRVALYPGRPVHGSDLAPPGMVERNQIVTLVFRSGGLTIRAEGRALDRGAVGDLVKVMNLSSRNTTTGHVLPDGTVMVGP